MKVYSQIICLWLVLLLISACAPAVTPRQATPPAATEPASNGNFHPLDTRTGIGEIDTVLAAIEARDLEELRSLIRYTIAPCTFADGLGGPPKCRAAETEGTELEVLPFMGGEGTFLRRDESIEWGGVDVTALYAIYRVSEDVNVEEYSPPGEYAIVFIGFENRPAASVRVGDGGIVRIDYIFDPSPASLNAILEREASEVILAPKE